MYNENESKTLEILSPKNCLKFEKRVLYLFGVYPIYGKTYEGNRLFYNFKRIITFTFSVGFLTSIFLNIFLNLNDSSIVIETLYFGLTQTTYISKLFNLHLRWDTFQELEKYLYTPAFNNYNKEQQIFIEKAIDKCIFFARAFRGTVTITILFFIVFPFLDNKLLPLPSYFPISVETYRIILFPYQIISIVMNGYNHLSFDIIVCTLITIGSAQFDILKDNLTNLRKGLDNNPLNRNNNDAIINKRLQHIIYHHVQIINYAYQIEKTYSFVQFVQFLASSIIMCVTGFQIIVTPIRNLKFITLVFYFACNFIQVLMCCWFGHDIMTKSEGIGEACYMSAWNDCGPSVTKSLFIIMERSKRPIVLTAGKFFDLTLQTLMQVLKSSYSYLALLNRMNEIKEL